MTLFPAFEKQQSRGRVLEHLESSGTEVSMKGPIVCKLYVGENIYAVDA